MTSRYIYRHLVQARREIRLLRIERQDGDATGPLLRCRIRHVALDDEPEYTVLSYTWGSSEMPKQLTVVDEDKEYIFPITLSLYQALSSISEFQNADVWVWIDAISINQADDEEKSWQVGMMRDIYHNTEAKIFCWLGEAADGSDQLFDSLHKLHLDPPRDILNALMARPCTTAHTLLGCPPYLPTTQHRVESESDAVIPFAAAVALFNRSYFERVWTKQETVSTNKRNIFFACGTKRIRLFGLVVAQVLRTTFIQASIAAGEGSGGRKPTAYEREIRRGPDPDENALHLHFFGVCDGQNTLRYLLPLLRARNGYSLELRHLKCQDPRDVVFGLVYLCTELSRPPGFKVDYAMDCRAVYTKVAQLLVDHGDLHVLQWAGMGPRPDGPSLPSWVPNFSYLAHLPIDEGNNEPLYDVYRGHMDATAKAPATIPAVSVDFDAGVLELTAIPIDTITGVLASPTHHKISDLDMGNEHLTGSSISGDWEYCLRLQQWAYSLPYLCPQGSVEQNYPTLDLLDDALYRIPPMDQMQEMGQPVRISAALQTKFRPNVLDMGNPDLVNYWWGTRFRSLGKLGFGTQAGRMGIAAGVVRPGDIIVLVVGRGRDDDVVGMKTPIVLRKIKSDSVAQNEHAGDNGDDVDDDRWVYVGEAYIHGIMDGEAIDPSTIWDRVLSFKIK